MYNESVQQLFSLQGKVALVTGSTRGIGYAIADGMARAGATVVVNSRREMDVESVSKKIEEKTGARCVGIRADLSINGEARRLVEEAHGRCGGLDVIVNNAGMNIRGDSLSYTVEEWDIVNETNLKSPFFVAQTAARLMKESGSGGSIINVLSLASKVALAGCPAYAASKGGLAMLVRTLAAEWAPLGIRVNGIGPGFVRTSLNEEIQASPVSDWAVRRTPMRRWGRASEIVGAAIFLASDASTFITGQEVFVDGGFLAGTDWRSGD